MYKLNVCRHETTTKFCFSRRGLLSLIDRTLLISEKLDFKIKIPRNAMCYHSVMFPNFSVFLKSCVLLPRAQNQNSVQDRLCFLLYRKDRRKAGTTLWKKNALLFVLASSSIALVLFAEVRPQSPPVSKTIGMHGLGDQLMHVSQLLYKTAVAVNASGL